MCCVQKSTFHSCLIILPLIFYNPFFIRAVNLFLLIWATVFDVISVHSGRMLTPFFLNKHLSLPTALKQKLKERTMQQYLRLNKAKLMGKTKHNLRNSKEKFQRSCNRHHTTITVPSRCTSFVRFAPGGKIS